MGCLTRLGCGAVLGVAALGAGVWWLNGGEIPWDIKFSLREKGAGAPQAQVYEWVPVSKGESTGAQKVASLAKAGGPAYVTLSAGEVAGLFTAGIKKALPGASEDVRLALAGDHMHIQTRVHADRLAGDGTLGTALGAVVGKAIGSNDTLHIAATVSVNKPGAADLHVDKLSIRKIDLPVRLIPPVVRALRSHSGNADSASSDAIPVPLPEAIGDIRISNGRMTIYRATPAQKNDG